jgi:hypothetical protein
LIDVLTATLVHGPHSAAGTHHTADEVEELQFAKVPAEPSPAVPPLTVVVEQLLVDTPLFHHSAATPEVVPRSSTPSVAPSVASRSQAPSASSHGRPQYQSVVRTARSRTPAAAATAAVEVPTVQLTVDRRAPVDVNSERAAAPEQSHLHVPRASQPTYDQGTGTAPMTRERQQVAAAAHDSMGIDQALLHRELQDILLLLADLRTMVPIPDTEPQPMHQRRNSSARNLSRPVIVHVVRDYEDDPTPYPKPLRPNPNANGAALTPVAAKRSRLPSLYQSVDSRAYTSWNGSSPSFARRSSSIGEEFGTESVDLSRRY